MKKGRWKSQMISVYQFKLIWQIKKKVKNIQKALTARILKRLDDGQPQKDGIEKVRESSA